MGTPANYTEVAQTILAKLDNISNKLDKVARQVEAIYREEDIPEGVQDFDQMTAAEQIRKYGQRIPYNMISDQSDVIRFRDFLAEARRKGSTLKPLERDMIDIADKNFDDIRLSSKHLMILKGVYTKLYNRPFPFQYKQGYMYKLEGYQPEWEWFA